MLMEMRDRSDSLFFKIIVGALIFVLCAFGFGAFNFFDNSNPSAAKVNGVEISRAELDNFVERRRQQLLRQLGENADPNLIDPALLQSSSLDLLVQEKLMEQATGDIGLAVSDYQVDKTLTADPSFQIDGKFDPATYRMLLAQNGLTPVGYKELTASSMVERQLSAGFGATPVLFDWELEQAAALFGQTRDIAYLTIEKSVAAAAAEVSDEEITADYEANGPDYMTDETVDVEYIRQSLLELQGDARYAPSDADLQEEYDLAKAEFTSEERRRASHILIAVNDDVDETTAIAAINAANARLDAGESFAQLATELSTDEGSKVNGGDLGFAGRGVYVGPFEEALFSMAVGEVSEPVVTEFGVHLIRLEDTEQTSYPEFAEQRAVLESQARRKAALVGLSELQTKMDEASRDSESGSLADLVAEFGLQPQTAQGISRTSGAGLFSDAALRDAVFATDVLDERYNSPAIRLNDESLMVVRVTEQYQPELKPLSEVRAQIETKLRSEMADLAVESQAATLYERLLAGEATTVIADDAGLRWSRVERARRQASGAPREVVAKAFEVNRPAAGGRSAGLAELANGDRALVVVSAVKDGSKGTLTDSELAAVKTQITRLSSDLEFDGFQRTLSESASIRRLL